MRNLSFLPSIHLFYSISACISGGRTGVNEISHLSGHDGTREGIARVVWNVTIS